MSSYPTISVIVIGLNVAHSLNRALSSVFASDYPRDRIEVIYVDSGSKDRSLEIVRDFCGVHVISKKLFSAAAARNVGFLEATGDAIQFLDGDSALDPLWLKTSVSALKGDVAAVFGRVEEKDPCQNLYHCIAHVEWHYLSDQNHFFGGNVLMQRHALERCGGYNPNLVSGEEADLSARLTDRGFSIAFLPILMATHDICMSTFSKYWKRAYRSGVGFANAFFLKVDRRSFLRVLFSPLISLSILGGGFLLGHGVLGCIFSFLWTFRSFRKIGYFQRRFSLPFSKAMLYAVHLSFVVFPQCLGAIRKRCGV